MAARAEHLPGPDRVGRVAAATEAWARLVLRALEAVPTETRRLVQVCGAVALAAFVVMGSAAACGPLDFQCKADAWAEGLVDGLRASFASLTQSMIQGIFTGSLGTLGDGGWRAGLSLAGRVGAVMAIVVVALAAVQIVTTLVAKQRQGILRAAIGAALAWPVASSAVWAAMQLVRVIDAISAQMIEDSHVQTLSRLADFTMVVGTATPVTTALVALFFVFCVFIPTVLLSLIMAFRNYGIVLAIAIAPVSLMVWGFGSLREMSRGWLKVVLALILTKPVLAIALVLAAELIVQSADELEIGGFLTGVAGLGMAVFAPFAAMGMVSGAMAVSDSNIMRGAEAGAGRFASRTAHSASQGAKRAGHRVAEKAASTNPKTNALWSLVHGSQPGGAGGGTSGSGVPGQRPPVGATQSAMPPTRGSGTGKQPGPSGQQGDNGSVPGQPGGGSGAPARGPGREPGQGRPPGLDPSTTTPASPAPGTPAPPDLAEGQGRDAATRGSSASPPVGEVGPQQARAVGARAPQSPAPGEGSADQPDQRPSGGPRLT